VGYRSTLLGVWPVQETRLAGIATILGVERATAAGRQVLSIVIGSDGQRLSEQAKTQVDPFDGIGHPETRALGRAKRGHVRQSKQRRSAISVYNPRVSDGHRVAHPDGRLHFKKVHAEHPSARTLAQMGLAEGSLQRWVDAEGHLTAALAAHGTPWIENRRNREALEQALAAVRGHIGTLLVVGTPGRAASRRTPTPFRRSRTTTSGTPTPSR
jgi:hypothetical protein